MTKRSKAIQWLTNSRRRFTVNNEKSYRLVLFKTLQKEKMFTLLTVALVACNFLRLCSSSVQWPLVFNFFPQETRKSLLFHRNHMLGTIDFTGSEHSGLPSIFLRAQSL